MYIYHEIARHRIAELHQQAERDALAIAISRARRARRDRPGPSRAGEPVQPPGKRGPGRDRNTSRLRAPARRDGNPDGR